MRKEQQAIPEQTEGEKIPRKRVEFDKPFALVKAQERRIYADLGGIETCTEMEQLCVQVIARASVVSRGLYDKVRGGEKYPSSLWKSAERLVLDGVRLLGLKRRQKVIDPRDVRRTHDVVDWARGDADTVQQSVTHDV